MSLITQQRDMPCVGIELTTVRLLLALRHTELPRRFHMGQTKKSFARIKQYLACKNYLLFKIFFCQFYCRLKLHRIV